MTQTRSMRIRGGGVENGGGTSTHAIYTFDLYANGHSECEPYTQERSQAIDLAQTSSHYRKQICINFYRKKLFVPDARVITNHIAIL